MMKTHGVMRDSTEGSQASRIMKASYSRADADSSQYIM
jgi:hypothetical protein